MKHVLITGANRGIGLALVEAYLAAYGDVHILATCRQPREARALERFARNNPDRVTILPLEVTSATSISAAVQQTAAKTQSLDVLINNAGVNPRGNRQSFTEIDADTFERVLQINTVAPLMVVQAFADLLAASGSGIVANISSQMGSITNRRSGGSYAYCASKAALNMVTRGLAADLHGRGVIAVTIHPGWVRTDMGGAGASLSSEESATGIVQVIARLTPADSGSFLQWDGRQLPW